MAVALLAAVLPPPAAASSEVSLSVQGPFWATVHVYATTPGWMEIKAVWYWKAPSGNANMTTGGYNAYQEVSITKNWVGNTLSITDSACIARLAVVVEHSFVHGEPHACPYLNTKSTSVQFDYVPTGHYQLILSIAGDFIQGADLAFKVPPGMQILSAQAGSSVLFKSIEDFDARLAASVYTVTGETVVAHQASTAIQVSDSLFGWYVYEAPSLHQGVIEIRGPENLTGKSQYILKGTPPGNWTFSADRVIGHGGFAALFVYVLDVPILTGFPP